MPVVGLEKHNREKCEIMLSSLNTKKKKKLARDLLKVYIAVQSLKVTVADKFK